jgi:pimeloyl-ACP methyl ester carboxylesterase
VQRQQRDVRGIPMRWVEAGDGPPTVLIHGIPTSPDLWRHVLPLVSGGRCLAFEMVGYGSSIRAGRDRDISVDRQVDYLLAWLDVLEIDRVVLVGHDLGGGVAHLAALRAPDRCAGLVLTNAIGYDSWPIPSVKAMRAAAPLLRHLPVAALYPGLAGLLARGHDDSDVAKASLAIHYGHYVDAGDGAAGMARQVSALDVRDTDGVTPGLRDLDVPARVVWGTADQFQTLDYGERFAWDLGTELRRIEGGKHFTPEDHPAEIAQAIDEVVAEA